MVTLALIALLSLSACQKSKNSKSGGGGGNPLPTKKVDEQLGVRTFKFEDPASGRTLEASVSGNQMAYVTVHRPFQTMKLQLKNNLVTANLGFILQGPGTLKAGCFKQKSQPDTAILKLEAGHFGLKVPSLAPVTEAAAIAAARANGYEKAEEAGYIFGEIVGMETIQGQLSQLANVEHRTTDDKLNTMIFGGVGALTIAELCDLVNGDLRINFYYEDNSKDSSEVPASVETSL